MSETGDSQRTARCGCGQLSVSARGAPVAVHACCCRKCQRGGGGAFSYSAFWPAAAVTSEGARSVWTQAGDSGRRTASEFCPTCGTRVCFRAEAYPGIVGIAVGCFADPDFAPPARVYWAARRHHWLAFPDGIELHATQPG